MTEHIKTEIANGVMTLTLSRVDKKNALTNAMYSAMSDELERAEEDPAVRVVLFHAVGLGTTMLLHCDLVFLADTAKLMTPFVNLALVPEAASSWLLPARIGHVRAYAMFAL